MKKGLKITLLILSIVVSLCLVVSSVGICYSLFTITGILNLLRLIGGIIVCYGTFLLVTWLFYNLKRSKKVMTFILLIISIILCVGYSYGTYYVYKLTAGISDLSEDSYKYETVLITFNSKYKNVSSIKDLKIGILEDTTDIEGYVLPSEVISENKLDENNTIMQYVSSFDLLKALYNEELDLIFISGNFVDVYGDILSTVDETTSTLYEFPDLEKKAIIVKKLTKTYKENPVIEPEEKEEAKPLTEPFTLLVLGVDSEVNGLAKNAAFNGDTIMMITFNPNTFSATMFSIPRDTYVPISCSGGTIKKVNSSAYGGVSCVKNTMEKLTGVKIDYYVKVNFKGVVSLVDALGGIEVDVPIALCEQNSNRAGGEYKICMEKGLQTLNGEQALALARNRYAFALGDFQRGQNQQMIIEAMLNKAKSIRSITQFMNLFDTVSNNIDTDISKEQLFSFYDVAKRLIFSEDTNTLNVQGTWLRGQGGTINEPSSGARYAFFYSKTGLNQIVNAMKQNLGLIEVEPVKTFNFSINKQYTKEVIGANTYSNPAYYEFINNFVGKSIAVAQSWANSHGVTMTAIDNETKEIISSIDYSKYTIESQSLPSTTPIFRIKNFTVYCKNKFSTTPATPTGNDTSSSTEHGSSSSEVVSSSETPSSSEQASSSSETASSGTGE